MSDNLYKVWKMLWQRRKRFYEEQKDEYGNYSDNFSGDGGLSAFAVPGVQPEYAHIHAGICNG